MLGTTPKDRLSTDLERLLLGFSLVIFRKLEIIIIIIIIISPPAHPPGWGTGGLMYLDPSL